ncbi:nucleolar and coiled-body phosphoprotein 1 [Mitosporidium daphniae]
MTSTKAVKSATQDVKVPKRSSKKEKTSQITQKDGNKVPKVDKLLKDSVMDVKSKDKKLDKKLKSHNQDTKPKEAKKTKIHIDEISKESKEDKSSKGSKKDNLLNEAKENKSSKESKENKLSKESKENKLSKESKENMNSNQNKSSKDSKNGKKGRDSKKSKKIKISQESELKGKNIDLSKIDEVITSREELHAHVSEDYFSPLKTTGAPFRRVDPNLINSDDVKTFSQYKDPTTSYGDKAFSDLGATRGRDFRYEKNKKKKGSYRGGFIDTGVHSIRFG